MMSILQWLPSILASLSVVFAVNIRQGVGALFKRSSYHCNHVFILNLCGSSLGIELGGPAYYDQQKVRTKKYGGKRAVVLADNIRAIAAIEHAIYIGLTLYFLSCSLAFFMAR